MDGKKYFMSKTLWANLLAMVALFVQKEYGFIIDAEVQLGALAAINALLRFVTKEPLDWGTMKKEPGFIQPQLILLLCAILTIGIFAFGCAATGKRDTPQATTAKSLLSARQLIITAATTADQLCSAGMLSQKDCDQAREIYGQATSAYYTAADAYLFALDAGDSKSWADFEKTQPRLMSLATSLDALVRNLSGVTGDRGPGTGDELEPVPASNGGAQ